MAPYDKAMLLYTAALKGARRSSACWYACMHAYPSSVHIHASLLRPSVHLSVLYSSHCIPLHFFPRYFSQWTYVRLCIHACTRMGFSTVARKLVNMYVQEFCVAVSHSYKVCGRMDDMHVRSYALPHVTWFWPVCCLCVVHSWFVSACMFWAHKRFLNSKVFP